MIDRFLGGLFKDLNEIPEGEPVRMVKADNPSPMTLDGTRTYLVGRARPAVIDPGPDQRAHVDAIVAALGDVDPVAILLTHSHGDHAGAALSLAERTGAPLMMGKGAAADPFDPARIARWLADGDTVETDVGTLRAVHTPGHAPEHLCFLWTGGEAPAAGALFVGDHIMGQGDTVLVAPPEGDLGAYLRSLDKLEALKSDVMYPAHGGVIRDPSVTVDRYWKHRTERIDQVVRALRRAGPTRAEQMVETVYGTGLDPALRAAAEASLGAILAFLVAEGEAQAGPDGTYALVG